MFTVKLHFNDKTNVDECIAELKKVSPVPFTTRQGGVDPRHIMSIPEALEAETAIWVEFETEADRNTFHRSRVCYDTYQRFSA